MTSPWPWLVFSSDFNRPRTFFLTMILAMRKSRRCFPTCFVKVIEVFRVFIGCLSRYPKIKTPDKSAFRGVTHWFWASVGSETLRLALLASQSALWVWETQNQREFAEMNLISLYYYIFFKVEIYNICKCVYIYIYVYIWLYLYIHHIYT